MKVVMQNSMLNFTAADHEEKRSCLKITCNNDTLPENIFIIFL